MALVTFRSKAAGEIYMFRETAQRIFEILGRPAAEQGVITADQLGDAISRLNAAVDDEKEQIKAAQQASASGAKAASDEPPGGRGITLSQRAFPLLEMLRAAQAKRADVTWGV